MHSVPSALENTDLKAPICKLYVKHSIQQIYPLTFNFVQRLFNNS